ncbi:adenosine deaminase [Glaciecola punicea ACAM 611]|jgi:adenosine deaminase|uniref:adenosine deaminase n=1 Tax=Glaciecola punicea ACAM 611 TaxID=1121923 RepID=H5T9U8_9ALTE|nr:adenosine deaminase [Glaciecola punicea]GAB55075.1 adenosine deaminase [Glaciecola punicea ACAM 611]
MTESNLPLIDLHRHLDGNIRVSSILNLAVKNGIDLPYTDEQALSKHVFIQDKTTDLMAFLQKLDIGVSVLAHVEDCEKIAYENVIDAVNEGLAHVELRFSPNYMARAYNLPLIGVVEAVVAGVARANKEKNYKAKLIGILSRTFGVENCFKELDAILSAKSQIVALDLAGDEHNFPPALFINHFKIAREQGLNITVHAGEAGGANSIWDAINLLGASRIGHGVAAINDNRLLSYMAMHKIGIESCILSNYQTGTWLDMATHPVKSFLSHDIEVFLNTDDPGVSNNTLADEYSLAKTIVNLDDEAIRRLKMNAMSQAFLSSAEKNAIKCTFNGV